MWGRGTRDARRTGVAWTESGLETTAARWTVLLASTERAPCSLSICAWTLHLVSFTQKAIDGKDWNIQRDKHQSGDKAYNSVIKVNLFDTVAFHSFSSTYSTAFACILHGECLIGVWNSMDTIQSHHEKDFRIILLWHWYMFLETHTN